MTREVAKKVLMHHAENHVVSSTCLGIAIHTAIQALDQEPKTGHWIDTGSGQECSECGEIQYGHDNFRNYCAYCGAKMAESEDKE